MRVFNVQGFRRIFVGDPIPDKDDPKYKERHEKGVEAGRRFARVTGLAWLAERYCRLAEAHKKAFFVIMLGMMTFFAVANMYRFYKATERKYHISTHQVIKKQAGKANPKNNDHALQIPKK